MFPSNDDATSSGKFPLQTHRLFFLKPVFHVYYDSSRVVRRPLILGIIWPYKCRADLLVSRGDWGLCLLD